VRVAPVIAAVAALVVVPMALAVVAALTVADASVIDARVIAAVEHAGADISLLETFGVGVPDRAGWWSVSTTRCPQPTVICGT